MKSPLLLYVNIPFCNSKCHFCDWVVQVPIGDLRLGPGSPGRRGHLGALQTQIAAHAPALAQRYRPEIMYWGGGTASILNPAEIETLHGALAAAFPLGDVAEATIESSPESLTLEKLQLLRGLGFNRISIGVQSFDDDRLRMIGRVHSAATAEASIDLARRAGFDNVNIDLIVGFPDQELTEVETMLRRAVSLPVNHYSIYAYRASQGTVLRRRLDRANVRTDLRKQLDAYRLATAILADHGFAEYTFAYFGAPICLADLSYYQMKLDWIGFGSGSFSVIDGRTKGFLGGKLHSYIANPTEFDFDVPLSDQSQAANLIGFALTTAEGVDAEVFRERTGTSLRTALEYPEVREYVDKLCRYGRLITDEAGIRFAREDIAQVFISMNWIEPAPTPVDLGMPAQAPA
ncbi:MAG TPA: coproporphyrinogen-III oxidase family protein [Streptosporangiaceae bacterium]|nr:coproporphyrinogen-III oxidase family protein [Streptosporangiaceae bacterium]